MQVIHFVDENYTDRSAILINEWVAAVSDAFEKSSYFEKLNALEKESYYFLLSIFFKYCYSYCLVGPGKLNEDVIGEMMLDVMPRKISAERSTFEAFAGIMEQFLQFCEEKSYMTNTESLQKCIHKLAPEMMARSEDPQYWGMAKSLLMLGTVPPVEMDDDTEGDGYWAQDTPTISTYRCENIKIGRNAICHCGSGKKYKKCCLPVANG